MNHIHDLLIVIQIGNANACAMAALRGFFAYLVMSAILTANAVDSHFVRSTLKNLIRGRPELRAHSLAFPPMVAKMVEQKTYPTDQPLVILVGMENNGPTP